MVRWYAEDEVALALTRMGHWIRDGEDFDSAYSKAMDWLLRQPAPPVLDDGGMSRLDTAVAHLATLAEGMQERLLYAGEELIPLVPQDFGSADTQAMFAELMARLTATAGGLQGTVRALSDHDAAELARDLVELHRQVLAERFPE